MAEEEKQSNTRMYLGIIVIILSMVLSYVFFPSSGKRDIEEQGFDFQEQVDQLKQDIMDMKPDLPMTTTSLELNGPGGCSTVEECKDYCSLPENEEECAEYFSQ